MTEPTPVLVVDDVPANLTAVRGVLQRPDLEVVTATSGDEALDVLLQRSVAVALLDVNMPGMTGFELAEMMRGVERTRRVPIIFLTANAPEDTRIFQGYESGAVDFLFKPIHPDLLRAKVEVFVELYRQRAQLARQLARQQEALRASDVFVGVLGHDLRNPLMGIRTSAKVLERKPDDPERVRRLAAQIDAAAARMTRLLGQLLEFARARVAGGVPVTRAPCDLTTAVRAAIEECGAPERVQVTVEGDTRGEWDEDRLVQLLQNLLGNALTHGEPDLGVEFRVDGSAADTVLVEVENAGTIPEEKRRHLFDPPVHTTSGPTQLGFGLFIVDQIARAHGGRVTWTSNGQTTFTVRLPRR